MAPEIFRKTGHGKPVDIWAMGVIAYFLLCGYTPFDRDSQQQEMEAICAGDYKFEPAQYWEGVSEAARNFVRSCLTIDQGKRPTAEEALAHPWLAATTPYFVPDPESTEGKPTNLLPGIRKAFDAKKTFRKAVLGMMAVRRLTLSPNTNDLARTVEAYKETAEQEQPDENLEVIFHHGNEGTPPGSPAKGKSPRPSTERAPPAQGDKEPAPKKPSEASTSGNVLGNGASNVETSPAGSTAPPPLPPRSKP